MEGALKIMAIEGWMANLVELLFVVRALYGSYYAVWVNMAIVLELLLAGIPRDGSWADLKK